MAAGRSAEGAAADAVAERLQALSWGGAAFAVAPGGGLEPQAACGAAGRAMMQVICGARGGGRTGHEGVVTGAEIPAGAGGITGFSRTS